MQPKMNIIKKLLRERGIDGAIVSSPENFHYICGFAAHQHTVSRQANFAGAVLSDADNEPVFAITMDFEAAVFIEKALGSKIQVRAYDTWVGARDWDEFSSGLKIADKTNMSTYFDVLLESVKELDLEDKTIGIEVDFVPLSFYEKLKDLFPAAEFVNISQLFIYARSVKTPEEIEMFRLLCKTADEAFLEVSKIAQIGVCEREMSQLFRHCVIESGICVPSSWSMFAVGANSAKLGLPTDARAKNGNIIKFDAGVNAEFDFYTTDTSRGWIAGQADPLIHRLKDRLYEAQRLVIERIKPGVPINELYRLGFDYVAKEFPSYRRGHLGHSISMGPQTAEAPFINALEKRPLEPCMILAIELPCYIKGLGGFNIEDMVLVTDKGCEVLTPKTPHYL
ncbi:MAG: Xaa-Pro peptidase family protein [Defluviitaleaceae bacterium]|nr:Xaa-Pro peptidase family protein [Defluviitaleaceae bacterium]